MGGWYCCGRTHQHVLATLGILRSLVHHLLRYDIHQLDDFVGYTGAETVRTWLKQFSGHVQRVKYSADNH